jgi:hypothetical protein
MIRQIARRFQEMALASPAQQPHYANGNSAPVPLLLLETRPPDGGAFNRADYYRTTLKLLGEPFYERRLLVDVDSEQAWEKKGRSRSKATQFNDSPELRHALEEAMARRGVRAVILDEAQHLLKVGSGASGGKLLPLQRQLPMPRHRPKSPPQSVRQPPNPRQLLLKSRWLPNQHPRKERLAGEAKKPPSQPEKPPPTIARASAMPPVPKLLQ